MKDPGYTIYDLAFWSGLIGGLSGTYLVLTNLPAYRELLENLGVGDFERIITLILGGLVGAGLGYLALGVVRNMNQPHPPDDSGDRPSTY